jgi:hypothetical protein
MDYLFLIKTNKFRSETETITWSDFELKRLIAIGIKILANLTHIEQHEIHKISETLFENKIESKKDSFTYIVARTLKRPREVIQFCNLALTIALHKIEMLLELHRKIFYLQNHVTLFGN